MAHHGASGSTWLSAVAGSKCQEPKLHQHTVPIGCFLYHLDCICLVLFSVFKAHLVFWVLTSLGRISKETNIRTSPEHPLEDAKLVQNLVPDCEKAGKGRKPRGKFHRFFSKRKSPQTFRWRHFFVCQDQHIHFACLACPNPTVLILVAKFISRAVVDSVGGWVGSQISNNKTEESFATKVVVVLTSTGCFPKTKDDKSQANMAEATSRRAVSFGLRKYQNWTGLGP